LAVFEPMEPRLLLDGTPLITEFLADNGEPWYETDPESDWDWIEIHNPTTDPISLDGWHLTDTDSDLAKWTFPAGITLESGEYLIVFASGRTGDPAHPADLHVPFGLSRGGEYLALVMPGGEEEDIVSEYDFPAQEEDVSYGLYQDIAVTPLVPAESTAYTLIPDAEVPGWTDTVFDTTGWTQGKTGVGFETTAPGLAVTLYKAVAGVSVSSLNVALNVVNTPSYQSAVFARNVEVINYYNTGGHGRDETGEHSFPGLTIGQDTDDFVIDARATLTISSAGEWTFLVNSDDGFRLSLDNGTDTFSIEYPGVRAPNDTLGVFNVTTPGEYDLRLIMFDRGAGAEVELWAAQGNHALWNATDFHLVGDTAGGGLCVESEMVGGSDDSYAGLIETDVEAEMADQNASAFIRIPFNVADPGDYDSLYLRMKYDDGFVAYLNGVEVARRNAPGAVGVAPAWNAAAADAHPNASALRYEDINISNHVGLLQAGTNVLAIHGLNDGAGDNDFLIVPELAEIEQLGLTPHFFETPSPGAPNLEDFIAFVGDTKFDLDRGFYDAPFEVTITCDTADAVIYYTTNSNSPILSDGSVSPDAHEYLAPVPITTTTTLRAAAAREGWEPSNVDTQTYIFLDDVIHQPINPAGFPTTWVGIGQSTAADYQMDPDIVNNPLYSDMLMDALLSIPTMSLVMDMDDLFDPSTGIYVNCRNNEAYTGVAWERAGSIEMFYPEGYEAPDDGFQVDCGVRMYGGVGRNPGFKKHAFRLLFKGDYGPTKLNYPLFGDDAADQFDTIILRQNFNDGYVWGAADSQYIRDEYVRQLQLALGGDSSHGNFVHLYVNGLYWGLYNPSERPDESFGAAYFGGDKDDWDAVNAGLPTGGSDLTEWEAMLSLCRGGMTTLDQYQRLQGNNPDGTDNPDYPNYLDVSNYAIYMLTNFFVGNADWPGHNWYAARAEDPGSTGFKSFAWDSEWVVGMRSDVNRNSTGVGNSIAEPYSYLRDSPEWRVLFGDIVHKAFFNGGPLYVDPGLPQWDPAHPERNQPAALYASLADAVELAMVGESARWGDVASGSPYTLAQWQYERDSILNDYLRRRSDIVLGQLKSIGLYPNTTAPTFSVNGGYQHGGTVSEGDELGIAAPAGTIYYTLDGSDPRLLGGGVRPGVYTYSPGSPVTLDASVHVKARVYSGGQWSALTEATFVQEVAPPLRVTEIMYNPPLPTLAEQALGFMDNELFEYIELQNVGDDSVNLEGMRLSDGVAFTFPAMSLAPGEYVLVVRNQAAFEARYGTGLNIAGEFENDTALANGGEDILVEEAVGAAIQGFDFDDGWYGLTDGDGFSLVVRDSAAALPAWNTPEGWRASWQWGGNPGADDPGYDPGSIVINEVLAHSDGGVEDWIELYNTTTDQTIDITGWFLSDSPAQLDAFQIPATVLGPGEYVAFNEVDHFGAAFALSELGDAVCLTSRAPDGTPGGYREDEFFGASDRGVTFGRYIKSNDGKDFVPLAAPTYEQQNSGPVIPDVVINEVMYNPADLDAPEWIELANRTGTDVPLYDPAHPENPWTFTDGIVFAFPAGAYVPAGGYALVVQNDPEAFRTTYGIPVEVPIYGPFQAPPEAPLNPSNLANEGERIELSRPGEPEPGTGFVPYIQAEKVNYEDRDPWPFRADGQGAALSRISPNDYGNDPANWQSSTVGGTPGALNQGIDDTPPTTPTDLAATVISDTEIRLTWTASEDPQSGVAYYRVYRDDVPIGESETTSFNDTEVDAARTYAYQVSAVNIDDIEGALSTPPLEIRLLSIGSVGTPDARTVTLVFTETVTALTAQDLDNYDITYDGGTQQIGIVGAVLQGNHHTVLLTLDEDLADSVTYTLAVAGVEAESGIGIVPGTQIEFQFYVPGSGTILREYWTGIIGNTIPSLTGHIDYPHIPTGANEMPLFEIPVNWAESYGTRVRGYLSPPATGNYTFYIASDDYSELWLSTDEDPAGAVLICRVNGWVDSRDWFDLGHPEQQSAPIHLEVGHRYYVEALHKESGGNDHLSVAWQLPDATVEGPIPSERLSPFVIVPPDVTVSIEATDPSAAEHETDPGTFTISRTGNTDNALTVRYTVSGTASNWDYVEALSGQVEFAPGETDVTIDITPNDDGEEELGETVILTLTLTGDYLVDAGSATVTIIDNDTPQDVTVNLQAFDSAAAEEGLDPGAFRITRDGPTDRCLTVYYTVEGRADSSDYTPLLVGQIDIPVGQNSVQIDITPVDDDEAEPDETIILTLLPDRMYDIGVPSAILTILDNDGGPIKALVALTLIDGNAAEEGPDTGTIQVYRNGDKTGDLMVYYDVEGTASAADYLPLTGQILIPAGEADTFLVVTPIDDGEQEDRETVILRLINGPGYLAGSSVKVVWINDNDPFPPEVSISVGATDASAAEEGPDPAEFTIYRVGPIEDALTVYYTLGGTADGGDYAETLTGQVDIPAGLSSVAIPVTPVDDPDDEPLETLVLTLTGHPTYGVVTRNATVTIADNDEPGPPDSELWLGVADDRWENPDNWSAGVVPGLDTTAVFADPAPYQPVLYANQAVKGLDFTTTGWTLGGAGHTLIVGPDGIDSVGTNSVEPNVVLAAPSVWTVEGGDTLEAVGMLDGAGLSLTKDGGGTLVMADARNLAGFTVEAGTVRLAASGTAVLVTQALDLAAGATLDIADYTVVIDYTGGASPLAQVLAWVASGRGEGAWDGTGLTSSEAAAHPQRLTAVGVIDNNDPHRAVGGLTELDGVPIPAESVLVTHTWYGDANLDGIIDSNDYDLIDTAWVLWTRQGIVPGGGFRWAVGDFTYDGIIDSNDYDRIDVAWLLRTGGLAEQAASVAAVSQPLTALAADAADPPDLTAPPETALLADVARDAGFQPSAASDDPMTLDPASGTSPLLSASADAFDAALTLDAEDVAPTSAAWSPTANPEPDADPATETVAGFADLLAGAALDVPLGT